MWKYYQSSDEARAKVLQILTLDRSIPMLPSSPLMPPDASGGQLSRLQRLEGFAWLAEETAGKSWQSCSAGYECNTHALHNRSLPIPIAVIPAQLERRGLLYDYNTII